MKGDSFLSFRRLSSSPVKLEGHRLYDIKRRGNPILPISKPNIYKLLPKEPTNMSFDGLNDSAILNFDTEYDSENESMIAEVFSINLSMNPLKRRGMPPRDTPTLHNYNISFLLQSQGDLDELEQSLRRQQQMFNFRDPKSCRSKFELASDSFDDFLNRKI